jgi:eukaryotic-like serine/threonine-protein kinase
LRLQSEPGVPPTFLGFDQEPLPDLGRYHPLQLLAVGGMAEIYRALVMRDGQPREVAVKRVRQELLRRPLYVEMFRREARFTIAARHDNVVRVEGWEERDDGDLLVLEYLDGSSLREIVESDARPLPPELAGLIAHQLACALEQAYCAVDDEERPLGILHRDISPCNVIITRDGRVKLVDFGIAKSLTAGEEDDLTQRGNVKGKLGYMAPEQLEGLPAGPRIDQFAVGIVLYEILVGRHLFDTRVEMRELRRRRWKRVPPPSSLRDVPAELENIVMRLIRPDESQRFQSWTQARVALEDYLFPAVPEAIDLQAWLVAMRSVGPFGGAAHDTELAIL